MSKQLKDFQVHTGVRVIDAEYERNGQVGVFLGAGDEPGEGAVRFEGDEPGAAQVVDTFPLDALEQM